MSMRRVVSVEQAEWGIAPPAEWVEAREPVWPFSPPEGPAIAVLLYDQQHQVATGSVATRTVRRLLTANAVRAFSQVELDFDPAAHRLVIHELAVWRQDASGRWEKRSHARREVFLLRQREQQLERQILNGRVSLVALLEDVRLGDAIDLWWTLEPRDELPGLHFTAFFSFGWSVPVALAQFTLHLSPEHPVSWRVHAPPDAPLPTGEATVRRATWKILDAPSRSPEPNTPPGEWPFALLDVSGWTSWGEVARFVSDLWSEALAHGSESVRQEALRLGAVSDLGLAARRTIRFVQEEIRYLALDFGQGGGILPDGAGNVLRRRFGDCKDKSVLLTALLRALGIDACPLLVAPTWRGALTRLQPSTSAFNHAIVTFTLDGKRYFADPTEVGQGGDLARLVAPPLCYGLEIRPDADGLLPIPELPPAELTLTETFELDPLGFNGSCEQVLSASAWLANDVREALVREGRTAFFKARTEALQRHFPALAPHADAPTVRDDVDANQIELRAKYLLPTWGPSEAPPPAKFHYGAHGLLLAVEKIPETEERTQSWMLRFPMKVRHQVVVRGNCVQQNEPETHRVDGTGFRYECLVRSKRHEVAFDYCWETTQQAISPAEWSRYRQDRSRAFERTGANVGTRPTPNRVRSRRSNWYWIPLGIFLVSGLSRLGREAAERRPSPWEQHPAPAHESGSRPGDPLPPNAASTARGPTGELDRAVEASRRGDYVIAAQLVERAEPIYSLDFDYQVLRADVMMHTGRFDVAHRAIDAARRLNPKSSIPDELESKLEQAEVDLAGAGDRTGR